MWTHKTRSKRKQLKHTDRGESPGDKEDKNGNKGSKVLLVEELQDMEGEWS